MVTMKDLFFSFLSYIAIRSDKNSQHEQDGSFVISFKVTQDMEVEELIKKWLPFMKVITPISLKQKIDKELRTYLGLDSEI